jgi:CubicO group peptidase (beta-lactamase class C family)
MAHKTTKFEDFVLEKIKEYNVPGLSIAIVKDGEIHPKVNKLISG